MTEKFLLVLYEKFRMSQMRTRWQGDYKMFQFLANTKLYFSSLCEQVLVKVMIERFFGVRISIPGGLFGKENLASTFLDALI